MDVVLAIRVIVWFLVAISYFGYNIIQAVTILENEDFKKTWQMWLSYVILVLFAFPLLVIVAIVVYVKDACVWCGRHFWKLVKK